jgi:hypothetical protein
MSNLDIHKDQFIRQLIRELQQFDPTMTFRDAWDTVLHDHPDLFKSSESKDQAS